MSTRITSVSAGTTMIPPPNPSKDPSTPAPTEMANTSIVNSSGVMPASYRVSARHSQGTKEKRRRGIPAAAALLFVGFTRAIIPLSNVSQQQLELPAEDQLVFAAVLEDAQAVVADGRA